MIEFAPVSAILSRRTIRAVGAFCSSFVIRDAALFGVGGPKSFSDISAHFEKGAALVPKKGPRCLCRFSFFCLCFVFAVLCFVFRYFIFFVISYLLFGILFLLGDGAPRESAREDKESLF